MIGACSEFLRKILRKWRGHGGTVVTHVPPTPDIGLRILARPQVGKLVTAYHWSVVYSTEH